MTDTCESCVYFFKHKKYDENIGRCRRYPATPMQIGINRNYEEVITGYQPCVSPNDWCGEHKKVH